MKRNIIYIALGAIALMMAPSCTDFLKENPQTFESPDNYYTTQEEMQKAVNGCYGTSTSDYIQGLPCMFQGMVGLGMNGHIYLEGMTGYSDRLTATNYRDMGFLLPLDQTTDGYNSNFWKGYYKSIENCNSTIKGIEGSMAESVSEDTRSALLAEVYFLRAYYYYRLVTLFGPVPYKTTPTTGTAGTDLAPDSEQTVFEGIASDLEHAETLAEKMAWSRNDGHVSKGAIKSLLAKVYLTMAGYPLQQTDCYAKAYAKAKEVVASKAFSLGSYADLSDPAKENSGEIIFAIQREGQHASNSVSACLLPITNPKVADNINNADALAPAVEFLDGFEAADARANAFFADTFTTYKGETVHTGRKYITKYYDPSGLSNGQYGLDYILIRYADILLVMAEAKVMADGGTTTDADAIAAFQQVHGRAFAGAAAPASLDFDTVYKERVWELCYENQTWFDMLRTRKAYDPVNKTVVNFLGYTAPGHAHVGSGAFTTTDIYLPYPVREKRLNPNLKR